MTTAHLPERPNIEQLRRQARDLQRAVRTGAPPPFRVTGINPGEPDYPLNKAQLLVARRYGFASWTRLLRHVEAINARTWTHPDANDGETLADKFVRLACLSYADDVAGRAADAAVLLDAHPDLSGAGVAAAAASADVIGLGRLVALDSDAATAPTGPYGWPALMYLTYSRIAVDPEAALGSAELLLTAGADPNDGWFFDGLPTPFTVLTGCFGGGERDQPPHPHAVALGRLLLSRGAEPNDAQTLYNRMFRQEDDFLEVLFEFGLGSGDGGPWRRLLPDLLPPPTQLLSDLMQWAVVHDQRNRVALLAQHGVDISVPLDHGATPLELALRNGHTELAEQLRGLGASAPFLDPVDAFISAALAGAASEVAAAPPVVVEAARAARPALVVWAAAQQRIEAVELLVAAGFDVNAYGRSDMPVEQPWQTALHTAAERGNADLARRLLELGADPALLDTRYHTTPLQWAHHLGHQRVAELLSNP